MMKLTCSAFSEGAMIPAKYTCDGGNVSPPLEWSDIPAGTKSLVLIVDDPDAPRGLFLHWLVYDMAPTESGLKEGAGIEATGIAGAKQGINGFGHAGYGGPCPPAGTHRYCFHLFALDCTLEIAGGARRGEVENAMRGHVLAEAQVMGRYQRRK